MFWCKIPSNQTIMGTRPYSCPLFLYLWVLITPLYILMTFIYLNWTPFFSIALPQYPILCLFIGQSVPHKILLLLVKFILLVWSVWLAQLFTKLTESNRKSIFFEINNWTKPNRPNNKNWLVWLGSIWFGFSIKIKNCTTLSMFKKTS